MSPLSILVISAAPDERDSTVELHDLVVELRRRPGVQASVWFLRRSGGTPWTGSKVVDDLRSSPLAAGADRLGLGPLAGLLRGRALRRWWRAVDPDVVLLDDCLGARLLPENRRGLVTVGRSNPVAPPDAALESDPPLTGDLFLLAEGSTTDSTTERPGRVLSTTPRYDYHDAIPFADESARRTVRSRIGIPEDVPLVVGWGDDAWFDGPDMFVRTIWTLEEHQGVAAHGLWLGDNAAGDVASVIDDEAGRCGLAGRIHHRTAPTVDVRLCGDVVLLPYRNEDGLKLLHEAFVTGAEVVTFPVWRWNDPMMRSVPHLDLDAAAAAVVESLGGDRPTRSAQARARLDVRPFADDLLATISDLR